MKKILIITFVLIFQLFAQSQSFQRIPMIEVFTSSTCGPCNPGNVSLNNVLNNYTDQYTLLKYQMSWPGTGDPYFTSEGGSRRSFYAVNSVPNLQVDGGFNGNPSSFSNSLFEQSAAIPSYTGLSATYTVSGQTVDVSVSINPHENITSSSKLYVAIFEHKTFLNLKSNGETEFENVMKKMLPGGFQGGQYIASLDSGVQQNYNFSYTFNGTYILPSDAQNQVNLNTNHTVEDFNNLGVAVWVQINSTKEILQSASATDPNSINEIDNTIANFSLYPNPADQTTTIALNNCNEKNVNIVITNLLGEVVVNESFKPTSLSSYHKVNLKSLHSGTYTISLIGDNLFTSKKLQIIK